MIDEIMLETEEKMQRAVNGLHNAFGTVRTGRANAMVLDRIKVDYYGVPTPINQMAGVKTPDAHMLVIEPWDKGVLGAIEHAIMESDLGVTPNNDGSVIRLPFPALTEDRRRELVKQCKEYAEEARVAIRNARRDGNSHVAKSVKEDNLPEDEQRRAEAEIQKLTDKYVAEVEAVFKKKEAEVMEILKAAFACRRIRCSELRAPRCIVRSWLAWARLAAACLRGRAGGGGAVPAFAQCISDLPATLVRNRVASSGSYERFPSASRRFPRRLAFPLCKRLPMNKTLDYIFPNPPKGLDPAALDPQAIPEHVAVIMDGNGRWAKKRALNRLKGHKAGIEAVRETIRCASDLGVRYLTIYSFSTENWKRPQEEVVGLMDLFAKTMLAEVDGLHKENVRVRTIGDLSALPAETREAFEEAWLKTRGNTGMTLVVAVNYGSRQEILHAAEACVRRALATAAEGGDLTAPLTEAEFAQGLYTADIPDPEVVIRTSGEMRLSNYLLWQVAYSEFVSTDVLWPDFNRYEFLRCLLEFQSRDRRFGAVK